MLADGQRPEQELQVEPERILSLHMAHEADDWQAALGTGYYPVLRPARPQQEAQRVHIRVRAQEEEK